VIATPPLHPDAAPLAFLLGTWAGEGHGEYPTIEDFDYQEEIRFWHVGKPFLAYAQRTWSLEDERPLHSESGYWRAQPGGRLEVVLAHPNGIVEVEEGVLEASVDGVDIELASIAVARSGTAKEVSSLGRHISVRGDSLVYRLQMAAVGKPSTLHLAADLRHVAAG
jgi:THAP4-like, heme-binding beta-barrel domain